MSEPFIAEVRIWALNFAPQGWAFCDGQLLPIAQNPALFALIKNTYGGDGSTMMALPNLQESMPMHPGTGPGLTTRTLGQRVGESDVTLTEAQMPTHNHGVVANQGLANDPSPVDQSLAAGQVIYTFEDTAPVGMSAETIPSAGSSQPHTNQSPYLNLNFTIAITGLYPSQS